MTLGECPVYLRALLQVKMATTRANVEAAVLDAESGDAIVRAARSFIEQPEPERFTAPVLMGGGQIAVHLNLNEVLAERAQVVPRHLTASQSTADVCHTAVRLALLEMADPFYRALDAERTAFEAFAERARPTMTRARTCLRDASVVSLGDSMEAAAAAIERRSREVRRALEALHEINLGGTVIGTGEGAPAAYRNAVIRHLCHITGRPMRLRSNLLDAAQNADDLAAVAAQLGLLAQTLLKIAHDLRLLGSGPEHGFNELILPSVMPGSTFYAGKRNPIVTETLMLCCMQVLGHERAARAMCEHAELNLNVFEAVAAVNLFEALQLLTDALKKHATECVSHIEINHDVCSRHAALV